MYPRGQRRGAYQAQAYILDYRDIQRLPTTPFSLMLRKEYFDCPQRDSHAVDYILKRGERRVCTREEVFMEGPLEPIMGPSLADVLLCTFQSTNAGFSSLPVRKLLS